MGHFCRESWIMRPFPRSATRSPGHAESNTIHPTIKMVQLALVLRCTWRKLCLIPKMEHLSCLSFHGQILSFKQRLRSKRAGVIIETSWKRIKSTILFPILFRGRLSNISRLTDLSAPLEAIHQMMGSSRDQTSSGRLEVWRDLLPLMTSFNWGLRIILVRSYGQFSQMSLILGGVFETFHSLSPKRLAADCAHTQRWSSPPRNDHIPQVTPMVEEHPGAFCIKVGSRHPSALHLASHSSLEWQLATSPWALAEWASALAASGPMNLAPNSWLTRPKKVQQESAMAAMNDASQPVITQCHHIVTTKRWWSLLPETLTLHKCKPHQGAVAGAAEHLTSRPKMWDAPKILSLKI